MHYQQLGSSIPSAGGVYSWASITPGPRWGRVVGFFAGFINFFGWLFDLASIAYILSELILQMYTIYHPNFQPTGWQAFIPGIILTWICVAIAIFFNRYIPYIQNFGMTVILLGGIITIIVVAAMPSQHASHSFVWTDFQNSTGWSGGVAFMTGVLNGAFTIGTPDAVSHLAEELPNPRRDIPRAVLAQIGLGTLYAFFFLIACFYGVNDLNAVVTGAGTFPIAQIYAQATGSASATFGLIFIIFLGIVPALIGTLLTVSRTYWALARDGATPFPKFFASVNEDLSCPIPAMILTGLLTTAFCAISIGSHTAFNDLVGSFVILTTTSYALTFAPHVLSGRKNVPRGDFWMGSLGYVVNGTAVVTITVFNIFFCFPAAIPTTVATMNYNSVILTGIVFLVTFWWFVYGIRNYSRPKIAMLYENMSVVEGKKLSQV